MDTIKILPSGKVVFGARPINLSEPSSLACIAALHDPFNPDLGAVESDTAYEGFSEHTDQFLITDHIGLSTMPKSHKPQKRNPRGLLGITTYGRDLVRETSLELGRRYDSKTLVMFTGTLPPGIAEQCDRLKWNRLVKNFKTKLCRQLLDAGLPESFVGVVEIQESRYLQTGVVGLHLHMIFVARHSDSKWKYSAHHYQQWWNDCIKNIFTNTESVDWRASCNIERLKGCPSRYLSKYLSKGSAITEQIVESGQSDKLPSAWYICSLDLRTWLDDHTDRRNGRSVSVLLDAMKIVEKPLFSRVKAVYREVSTGLMKKVGYVGYLYGSDGVPFLQSILDALSGLMEQGYRDYSELVCAAAAMIDCYDSPFQHGFMLSSNFEEVKDVLRSPRYIAPNGQPLRIT